MKNFLFQKVILLMSMVIVPMSAHSQFIGFNVDGALGYSNAESVSGGVLGFTHPIPFIPNLGLTAFTFNKRDTGYEEVPSQRFTLDSQLAVTSFHFFYHLPVPFVNVAVGLGAGSLEVQTDVIAQAQGVSLGTVEETDVTGGVAEGFVRIGYSLFPLVDLHFGYHLIQTTEVELDDESDIDVTGITTKKDFSGGLTTLGFQIGL